MVFRGTPPGPMEAAAFASAAPVSEESVSSNFRFCPPSAEPLGGRPEAEALWL